jgi:hypothetical protein
MFALIAQKRALKAPAGSPANRGGDLKNWVKDEEGFHERWPDNKRPDHQKRSTNPAPLMEEAKRLNEAQLRGNFLDWLYVVDVDVPVHPCNDGADCDRFHANWLANREDNA